MNDSIDSKIKEIALKIMRIMKLPPAMFDCRFLLQLNYFTVRD